MNLHLLPHHRSRGRPRVVPRPDGGGRVAGDESLRSGVPAARDGYAVPAPGRWRSTRSAARRTDGQGRRAPPIKQPTWKWYIPIYFWSGGLAGGAWLAAAAEDIAGEGDPDVIRAARYIAAGGVAAGTVLLIIDLGRPDRFLNMLRIVRPRSTMSLGSWGLAIFGAWSGGAALLQALDDGVLGQRRIFARLSRGEAGWVLHMMGLPLALFVGGYTGVLLGTTSAPAWARRAQLLGPLFTASAVSTGMSAVSLALEATGGGIRSGARRRLARAESAALAVELVLAISSRRSVRALPSVEDESPAMSVAYALTLGAGMALPLAAQLAGSRSGPGARSRVSAAAALLTLAGGLALRFITTLEGKRSALTPDDTWVHTGGKARGELAARRARPAWRVGGGKWRAGGPSIPRGEVRGVITIVQEDRIRVVDGAGRGYLFTLAKGRASPEEVEAWRDRGVPVRVRYRGVPDVYARAERITPVAGSAP